MARQPFFIIEGGIFLPPKVEVDSKKKCPTCRKPAIHVQPRVERPAYVFRCESYHEWAVVDKKVVKKDWESNEPGAI